jgi:hypothetical protein
VGRRAGGRSKSSPRPNAARSAGGAGIIQQLALLSKRQQVRFRASWPDVRTSRIWTSYVAKRRRRDTKTLCRSAQLQCATRGSCPAAAGGADPPPQIRVFRPAGGFGVRRVFHARMPANRLAPGSVKNLLPLLFLATRLTRTAPAARTISASRDPIAQRETGDGPGRPAAVGPGSERRFGDPRLPVWSRDELNVPARALRIYLVAGLLRHGLLRRQNRPTERRAVGISPAWNVSTCSDGREQCRAPAPSPEPPKSALAWFSGVCAGPLCRYYRRTYRLAGGMCGSRR